MLVCCNLCSISQDMSFVKIKGRCERPISQMQVGAGGNTSHLISCIFLDLQMIKCACHLHHLKILVLGKMTKGYILFCMCQCCNHCIFANYLQGLWVNFPKNQLFCLLGPNGAGKTTTINCLTGITPVTEGDGNVQFSCLLISSM